MALLKYKTDEGWKILYGGLLSKILRKDKNLSDLENVVTAKENLGLIGDVSDPEYYSDEETHNHDSRYPLKNEFQDFAERISNFIEEQFERCVKKAGDTMAGALNFANHTWNKMGDDANIGDRNLAGKVCIQGQNGETGLAMYQKGSDSNYGTLNYNGTSFNFNKPVNISGNTKVTGTFTATGNSAIQGNETVNGTIKAIDGFIPDRVDTPQLNNYHQKVNFIWGEHPAGTNNHLTPFFSSDSRDYGGIVFGSPINTSTSNAVGGIVQLISNCGSDSRLLYRGRDGSSYEWGAWKQIATLDDVNNAKSIDTQSVATNGYIKFSNGLMIQWGKQYFEGKYIMANVNFHHPYFSQVYTVIALPQRTDSGSTGGTYTCFVLYPEVTTTGFKLKSQIEKGSNQYIHWIAIGK